MNNPTPAQPLRLALIGAGIFMRDAHVPSLLNLAEQIQVRAVYSRTAAAAAALAARFPGAVDVYTDVDALLARPDVDAVDIALPIPVQADIVRRALAAGKHVLSEKPIAPDQTRARELMDLHARQSHQIWMVGENLRYESVYPTAAALLRDGAIGTVRTLTWNVFAPLDARSKYYATAWRRAGDFPGGLLLDGGVHHVAVMRTLLGEITQVNAMVQQVSPALPPADTLVATLRFAVGAHGTYLATYAVDGRMPQPVTLVGDDGVMLIHRDRIDITDGAGERSISCPKFDGVEKEMAAFVEAIHGTGRGEHVAHENTPAQALQDLAVVEALLAAAAQGATVDVPPSPARAAATPPRQ